jgi:Mechanosensitive ion channel
MRVSGRMNAAISITLLSIGLLAATHAGAQTQAEPVEQAAEVRLHDALVFKLLAPHRQESAELRARAASRALEHALETGRAEVRFDTQPDSRVIFVGDTPIVELYQDDALAAGGTSLDVYAAKLASQVRVVVTAERKRSDIAATVFSLSLVVFFGFIALYVLRKIGELAKRAREAMIEHPELIAPVRLNRIEVIGAVPLRALALAAVIVARWALQVGVVYIWLVLSLSRFDATRPYTGRLTSSLLGPLTSLAQRALGALPIGVLSLALAASVYVVLRFVELFFAGVSRGQERAAWVPRDLVAPTSLLIRTAIVLLALIFAGPAVTGDPEGVLARLGSGVLLALALAATPLLCSGVLGVVTIFSRRLRAGRHVQLGEHSGRVQSVGLLDVVLRDAHGDELRVGHLYALMHPLRLLPHEPRIRVELCVSSSAPPATVLDVLLAAVSGEHDEAAAELLEIDADRACYAVTVASRSERRPSELRLLLAEALARASIPWGRARAGGSDR